MIGRRRHLIAVAVAAGVIAAVPAPASAAQSEPPTVGSAGPPPPCVIRELPRPAWGEHSGVIAGDPTGRWLGGYAAEGKTDGRPVVWHGGTAALLEVPLESAIVWGINRHGVAVGSGDTSQPGISIAFAYDSAGDAYLPLATPAGARLPAANGISADGIISGWAYDRRSGQPFAIRWSLDSREDPQRLRVPKRFVSSRAVGVSPDGQIAVAASDSDGFARSFLFTDDGRRTRLPGVQPGSLVEVMAIARGWAAGREDGAAGSHLFRTNLATGQAERVTLGIEFTLAVNSSGVLGARGTDGGVLYTDRLIELPGLPGGSGSDVRTLDDAGRPAGSASTEDGTAVPVRWSCDLD